MGEGSGSGVQVEGGIQVGGCSGGGCSRVGGVVGSCGVSCSGGGGGCSGGGGGGGRFQWGRRAKGLNRIFLQLEFRFRNGLGRLLASQSFNITHLINAELLAKFCTTR